ncbi:hypothetical protein M1B35_17590 [Pseudomonas sp. MAFF 302046]|uniref:Uncharacterized protein n=1 Tax=Pseudomonas morbosilactucae TaxID=2938197 RepID=A0ABT0JJ43_9PSED|nr:hypothetical protein [Pseudomonas morbosilactucae]MCK9815890.1 hypothetical protein [Pseudomonas morbosilactucae]
MRAFEMLFIDHFGHTQHGLQNNIAVAHAFSSLREKGDESNLLINILLQLLTAPARKTDRAGTANVEALLIRKYSSDLRIAVGFA